MERIAQTGRLTAGVQRSSRPQAHGLVHRNDLSDGPIALASVCGLLATAYAGGQVLEHSDTHGLVANTTIEGPKRPSTDLTDGKRQEEGLGL